MRNFFKKIKEFDDSLALKMAVFPPLVRNEILNHKDLYISHSIMRTVFVAGILLSIIFWLASIYNFRIDFFSYTISYWALNPNLTFVKQYSRILSSFAIFVILSHFVYLLKNFDVRKRSIFWWHPDSMFKSLQGKKFYKTVVILTIISFAALFFPSLAVEGLLNYFESLYFSKKLFVFLAIYLPFTIAFLSYFLFLSLTAIVQLLFFSKSIRKSYQQTSMKENVHD